MSRLSIPIPEHNKIRTSPALKAELIRLAKEIADEAGRRADPDEPSKEHYGHDLRVGTDRARAHVWPKSGEAINAENNDALLLQIVAERGGR
jgi:hypothetical protein